MKLHAFHREVAMAHGHDLTFVGACRNFQHIRQRLRLRDQRMVTARLERLRQSRQDAAAIVMHVRRLAMHETRGAHDFAAEHFDERLMPEADAEHRHLARERGDHLHRDSGIVWRTGTGRDAQVRRLQRLRLVHRNPVVAMHEHLGAEDHEGLHQVVGEGIVVVDQQQSCGRRSVHRPSSASASARRTIALFANTSSYSVCGTLSATRPAPA
jgi:hypothetical protein